MKFSIVFQGLLKRDSWTEMRGSNVLMMCHDVDRGVEIKGQIVSQLIDPVKLQLIELGYSVNVLSLPFSATKRSKVFGQTYSFNRKFLLLKVLGKVSSFTSKFCRTSELSYEDQFWVRLLKSLNCRIVVLIGAPAELCRAATKLNIPVVELLHGYGYHQIPWDYDRRRTCELPSRFVAFDETSLRTFQDHFANPIETYFARRPNIDEIVLPCTENVEMLNTNSDMKVAVLVSLGWMEFKEGELVETSTSTVWPKFIDDIQSIAGPEIQWYVRPHPMMMRERRFRKHMKIIEKKISSMDNCSTIEEACISLPTLLRRIDAHLTSFSEIAFEAAIAGVPTLFLSEEVKNGGRLRGRFEELFRCGVAGVSNGKIDSLVNWVLTSERLDHSPLSRDLPSVVEVLTNEVISSVVKTEQ